MNKLPAGLYLPSINEANKKPYFCCYGNVACFLNYTDNPPIYHHKEALRFVIGRFYGL